MLAITFLTYNDKELLFPTLHTFFQTTIIPINTNIYILAQNASKSFIKQLQFIITSFQKNLESLDIKINIYQSENLGLSKANNYLFSLTEKHEFVLHIEDDWLIHPDTDKHWLLNCLEFMKTNSDTSTISLRKFMNDEERYHYGWTRNIIYLCHEYKNENFNYQHKLSNIMTEQFDLYPPFKCRFIDKFLFTFNPVIRRNKDYITSNVYPLPDYQENRNQSNWGFCEAFTMEKIRHLKTLLYEDGVFFHFEDAIDFCKNKKYGLFNLSLPLYNPTYHIPILLFYDFKSFNHKILEHDTIRFIHILFYDIDSIFSEQEIINMTIQFQTKVIIIIENKQQYDLLSQYNLNNCSTFYFENLDNIHDANIFLQ